jgi:hypothetical protein
VFQLQRFSKYKHIVISHSSIVDRLISWVWLPRSCLILKRSSKGFHFVTKLLVLIDLSLSLYLVNIHEVA